MRASLTRRRLFGVGASFALAAPAIAQAEMTPQDFGAKGNGTDDTAAFRRAVREAARRRRPLIVPRGDYLLVPPAEPSWNFRNQPNSPVHVCVELFSNVTVVGRGGRIVTRLADPAPTGDAEHARTVLFGTGLNPQPGALRDILFEDLEIDFADQFGALRPRTYAFGLTGVDNFHQRNLHLRSTGRRAGRGLFFQNGRGRQQIGCRHENMVQGHYIHYEWNPVVRDVSFRHLTECMDWDGPCWGVDASNLHFKDLVGEAQCIDTGGGSDWSIRNVTAENTGSIIFIYIKPQAWPTYQEWLNSDSSTGTATCVIPERMTVSGVTARNAGNARRESFRVSNMRGRRLPEGISPARDIVLEDFSIDGGYAANVNECRGIRIQRMRLRGMQTPDDSNRGAALSLRQSLAGPVATRESELSGSVSDLTIENSAGIGLLVEAPSTLSLNRVRVDGYNTTRSANTRSGIELRNLDVKPGRIVLDDVDVRGGMGSDLVDIHVAPPRRPLPAGRLDIRQPVTGATPGARSVSLP